MKYVHFILYMKVSVLVMLVVIFNMMSGIVIVRADCSGYVVRLGDTLYRIARANGTTWQELARVNGLTTAQQAGRTLIAVAVGLWLACVLGALLVWGLR